MKNFMLLALVALFFIAGCAKDNSQTEPAKPTQEEALKAHASLMDMHLAKIEAMTNNLPSIKTGEHPENQAVEDRTTCNRVPICHKGNSIVINKNAVPAHLGHGDQLTCCETSCINESAELKNAGPYEWYYDGEGDDCFGYQEFDDIWVAIGYPDGFIAAEAWTFQGTTYYWVYSHNHVDHSGCFAEVSQAEYVCAKNYLLSVVAANSCIPNLCNF